MHGVSVIALPWFLNDGLLETVSFISHQNVFDVQKAREVVFARKNCHLEAAE